MRKIRLKALMLALAITLTMAAGLTERVQASSASGGLSITDAYCEVMVGSLADATFTITNITEYYTYYNVTIGTGSDGGLTVTPVVSSRKELGPGESWVVHLSVNAENASLAGSYGCTVPITYFTTNPEDNNAVKETGPSATVNVTVTERGSSETLPTPTPTPAVDRAADLVMTAPTGYSTTQPGQAVTVAVTLQNNSKDNHARNLTITPGMLVDFKSEFSRRNPVSLRPGEKETFMFIITPLTTAKEGVYQVPFNYSYQGLDNKTYYGSGNVTVKVEEKPALQPNLVITGYTSDLGEIKAGDSFTVTAYLDNMGDGAAEAVEVSVSGFKAKEITLSGSDTAILQPIATGDQQTAAFSMTAAEEVDAGTYPIKFTVKYKTPDGESKIFESSYYVNIAIAGTSAGKGQLSSYELTSYPQTVDIGDTVTISYTVINNGAAAARNIRVTAEYPDGLAPTNANVQLLNELAAGDAKQFTFTFTPSTDVKSQTHLIGIKTEYETGQRRSDGTLATEAFSQYVSVTVLRDESGAGADKARLTFSSMTNPSKTLNVGQSGAITMTLTNNGSKTATNVKITGTPASGVVPSSANVQTLDEIPPGESRSLSFSFMPESTAKTQTYTVGFAVEYENGLTKNDGTPVVENFTQYGSVNAYVPETSAEGGSKSVPKIILSEYKITSTNEDNPIIVLAGREFDLYLRVKNTHPTKTVKNIIVSLTVPETTGTTSNNVFSPVGGSNSFYIGEIAPGEEFENTLRMFCLNNALGKNYVILVKFSYEDDEGNAYNTTEEVGITVRQQAKLELGPINFPTMMNVGDAHYLSFYYRNIGYVTLKNLKIEAKGIGFDGAGAVQLVGNFGSGGYDYYDGSVLATEAGEHTLQIVVTYDLDTGEHVEYFEEATVTVTDGGMGMGEIGGVDGMGMMSGVDGIGGISPSGDGLILSSSDGVGGNVADRTFNLAKDIFQYFNDKIWPWFALGGLVAAAVIIPLAVGAKRRKEFSLDE